jgi:AmmeMemoRadiSam system protein A
MSHYHDYDFANRMDAGTIKAIQAMDAAALFNGNMSREMEMCGFVPVTTGLLYAKRRGLKHAEVLKYANSGDVTNDKGRVVGYSSTIFYSDYLPAAKEAAGGKVGDLSDEQKKQLVSIARTTLDNFVRVGKAPEFKVTDERLLRVQGAFVTLQKQGQLRGCIGNIIGQEPLWQTVRNMVVAAASQDPRFKPVSADELKDIHVEVSVLSVPKRVTGSDDIMLGRDGVIVSDGKGHQGVFLPQVATETGWSKEEFLSQLCSQKAGLSADAWKDPGIELYTFTANVFSE